MAARTGAQLIEDERLRQVEGEGYTEEHDNQNAAGELVGAAVCYALVSKIANALRTDVHCYSQRLFGQWPFEWGSQHWKPSADRIRNLEKAGALIAAEIDRLMRSQPKIECSDCKELIPGCQMFLHVETASDGVKSEQLCLDCKDARGLQSTAEAKQ